MIGKTISHYKILEKLGEGGMGVVYKAEDTKLKRIVALKFLPSALSSNQEANERFIQEAQAASALEHPNICTIYEIDETDDGHLFIVMAYYEGESLNKKIEREPLDLDSVIDIASQIAAGLARTHEAGITHRDIKPGNIMVTERGEVKILDFGLAKLIGRAKLTKTGSTVGTAAYISHEQAWGEEVDSRTDIWSLGVVMYEMLSGQLPFRGEYEQAVIYSILNEKPERLTSICPDVPAKFEEIINKCLEKTLTARYKDVNELICALQDIKNYSKPYDIPHKKSMRKDRGFVLKFIIPLLFVLFAVVAVTSYIILKKEKTEEPKLQSVAVLPFVNIRNDTEFDFLSFSLANQVIGGLTYINNISVRPSSSIRKYEKQTVDAPTAGRELQVDYVLAGHYLKEINVVRLDVELVNVQTNEIIWREPIEVQYENAFKLQDIVSEKVIDGLKIQFSPDERQRMQTDIPQNPLAYEYYLRSLSYPLSNEGHLLAIEMLKKSIQLDSTYAPALVELGHRTTWFANYALRGVEELKKAERYYLKALSLNSELLSALSNLAALYNDIGRKEKSMELVRKALEINPNDACTHFILSYIYRFAGMLNESVQEVEKALKLDPNNPAFRSVVLTYIYLGKFNKAFEASDIDEGSTWALTMKGTILLQQGLTDQATKYFNQVLETESNGMMGLFAIGFKAYIGGNIEEGLRAIQLWEHAKPYNAENLYALASVYGLFGDKTGCIRVLRKAVESGFFNYPFICRDPFLDSVRNNPEFQKILALAKEKHEAFKKKYFPES